ncbi:hypothetical protein WDZ16_09505 [Pseudokineococcus marinus]|uniref:Antitoxin FitA-like ribbon-helix-helix domain-containing protein n=1 Tax=Pseudokineococcus marinus TaxID=351215 RepID=A0A849BET0_9ACTN|nr:hypothetical protein [Pseudokineococcus marinus]NNH21549.1 hypothetical protein [Pseudokineococcus marinus]
MVNILVRDVPDDVHAALQRTAARRHQSMQQLLVEELREVVRRRSVAELLDEVEQQRGGRVGLAAAVADLDDDRTGR